MTGMAVLAFSVKTADYRDRLRSERAGEWGRHLTTRRRPAVTERNGKTLARGAPRARPHPVGTGLPAGPRRGRPRDGVRLRPLPGRIRHGGQPSRPRGRGGARPRTAASLALWLFAGVSLGRRAVGRRTGRRRARGEGPGRDRRRRGGGPGDRPGHAPHRPSARRPPPARRRGSSSRRSSSSGSSTSSSRARSAGSRASPAAWGVMADDLLAGARGGDRRRRGGARAVRAPDRRPPSPACTSGSASRRAPSPPRTTLADRRTGPPSLPRCDDVAALARRSSVGVRRADSRIPLLGKGSNVLVADEGLDGRRLRPRGRISWPRPPRGDRRPRRRRRVARALCAAAALKRGPLRHRGALGHPVVARRSGADQRGRVRRRDLRPPRGRRLSCRGRAASGAAAAAEIPHGYRWSALVEAETSSRPASLRLRPAAARGDRRAARPGPREAEAARSRSEPNAGSVFKNPPGDYAGRLLEACGLKGARERRAPRSRTRHANVIVNLGGATAADVRTLMARMREAVRERFGVDLVPEVDDLASRRFVHQPRRRGRVRRIASRMTCPRPHPRGRERHPPLAPLHRRSPEAFPPALRAGLAAPRRRSERAARLCGAEDNVLFSARSSHAAAPRAALPGLPARASSSSPSGGTPRPRSRSRRSPSRTRSPDAILAVLPSDQAVRDGDAFHQALERGRRRGRDPATPS